MARFLTGWVAGLSVTLFSLAAAGAPLDTPPTARVAQGDLVGVLQGDVASFKNLPFAAPPVGGLRWKPPQAPAAWTGPRKADAYGPACIQPTRPGQATSEDCLSLNVWTPAKRAKGARLPVMVWIHGGAFVYGSGGTPFYDGSHFAQRGVVLVTLNYRLGRFGFFAHPALTAEDPKGSQGDYGFMDQIAALKWVQANIAAFGGDKANVTVFGESAGAISVNYLLVSPLARGLFAKAISESGFARTPGRPIRGGENAAETVGVKVAAGLGVTGEGAQALAALRALSAETLNTPPKGLQDPLGSGPIIDGVIAPVQVPAALQAGVVKVPVMLGGNSWEASLFPDIGKNPDATLARAGPVKPRLLSLYGPDPSKAAVDVTTDLAVIEPNRFMARQIVKAGRPAYVYYFSYLPAAVRSDQPGAPHGGEITYVFGNLPATPWTFLGLHVPAATADDRKISDAMIAYWVQFAKSGAPGNAGGPVWPAYGLAADPVMEFGADGVQIRDHFEQVKLDFDEAITAFTPR